jgi:polyphenol oxidase
VQRPRFHIFDDYPNVVSGISTRNDGQMRDHRWALRDSNAARFLQRFDGDIAGAVFANQVHGARVHFVADTQNQFIESVDGLVTNEKGIYLCIVSADCLPLVFYEPTERIVGVAHAGYKGLLGGMASNMVESITAHGGQAVDTRVVIGPGIGGCCYDVSRERMDLFSQAFPGFKDMYEERGGELFLDIKSVVKQQLLASGVKAENIEDLEICTRDHMHEFYSYRGDSRETFGVFMTFIGCV